MILSIALALVYHRAMIEPDIGWVSCPKHMAIEIPSREPFAGSYVACENFDKMQEMLEVGRVEEARSMLLVFKEASHGLHGSLYSSQ